MPSKVVVSSPTKDEQKIRCGFCNGVVKQSDVDLVHSKNCTVCGQLHKIKPRCAFNMVAKATGSPTTLFQQIDKETLKN